MNPIKIAVVAPSGIFDDVQLEKAVDKAESLGFSIVEKTHTRRGCPGFLNGQKDERILELSLADAAPVDAIWCTRGGCGALELWHDYQKNFYENSPSPFIGYSDITIFHFTRFLRASRIGIHGPVFLDFLNGYGPHFEAIGLLIRKQAQKLHYPALNNLNHFLNKTISGELVPMNLASLQSIIGCFDKNFLRGKILALEDKNEPHYKVFRMMQQLKNAGVLVGLRAILLGYFSHDREAIIEQTMIPLANELGIPLFDWPIFGHDQPNWPLLFGARVSINQVGPQFFTLTYDEQHDHTPIQHDD